MAIGRVIDGTLNPKEEVRNPLAILEQERKTEDMINKGIKEGFTKATTQEEMAEVIKAIGASDGHNVEVVFTDEENSTLEPGDAGKAYVRKETDGSETIVILVNANSQEIEDKSNFAGMLVEEYLHGVNDKTGANKGKGTETLAGYGYDRIKDEMKDETGKLTITGDGNDYNGIDFVRHVGDKWYFSANELLGTHLKNGTIDTQYFANTYGNGNVVDYVAESVRWEKAITKKELLYDFFIDELVSEIKGAYKYIDWAFKLVDVGKIIIATKKSKIEGGLVGYAYTKKLYLQEMTKNITLTSSVEARKIMQEAAKIHFGDQLITNNTFQDYVDDLMYDFYTHPDKLSKSNYTSEIKKVLTDKKKNPLGFTIEDITFMAKDVKGSYDLGDTDPKNKGKEPDPDYFFETGKFQFKPGMSEEYIKKLGVLK